MATFQSPVDISNRGLDHVGGRAITSFADGSRNAAKAAEVYDKLRQAELRSHLWVFATRKARLRAISASTMEFVPAAWVSSTSYLIGDVVLYNGRFYIALQGSTGVAPVDANGGGNYIWDCYYGPLTVDAWQAPGTPTPAAGANGYAAGELCYLAPGNGSVSIFLSLVDNNTDDPLAAADWVSTTTYMLGQIVEGSNGTLYQSNVSLNTGNDPTIVTAASAWSQLTTYAVGAQVYYTDGMIYTSNTGSNLGNTPGPTSTYWTATNMWGGTWRTIISPQPVASSNKWHFVAGTLMPLNILFPMGTGPVEDTASLNVFMLPSGYLHQAPQEEALGGQWAWLGSRSGPTPRDWVMQGRYILAGESLITCRFISDFQNVTMMDPLFCEAFGAKIGDALCETVTQDPQKRMVCKQVYKDAIGDAMAINAIEVGPVTQEENLYMTVRY